MLFYINLGVEVVLLQRESPPDDEIGENLFKCLGNVQRGSKNVLVSRSA